MADETYMDLPKMIAAGTVFDIHVVEGQGKQCSFHSAATQRNLFGYLPELLELSRNWEPVEPNEAHYFAAYLQCRGQLGTFRTPYVTGTPAEKCGIENVHYVHGALSDLVCLGCGTKQQKPAINWIRASKASIDDYSQYLACSKEDCDGVCTLRKRAEPSERMDKNADLAGLNGTIYVYPNGAEVPPRGSCLDFHISDLKSFDSYQEQVFTGRFDLYAALIPYPSMAEKFVRHFYGDGGNVLCGGLLRMILKTKRAIYMKTHASFKNFTHVRETTVLTPAEVVKYLERQRLEGYDVKCPCYEASLLVNLCTEDDARKRLHELLTAQCYQALPRERIDRLHVQAVRNSEERWCVVHFDKNFLYGQTRADMLNIMIDESLVPSVQVNAYESMYLLYDFKARNQETSALMLELFTYCRSKGIPYGFYIPVPVPGTRTGFHVNTFEIVCPRKVASD